MTHVNVCHQAFGHKVQLVTEAFDQHAGMALDLLDSLVKSRVHFLEAGIESLLLPFKALVYPLEALFLRLKSLV